MFKFAKMSRRGLLADGKDATQYGLSQSATSSPEEWAKRGTNLIDNGLEHLAVQCFLQALHLYFCRGPCHNVLAVLHSL